EVLSKEMPRKLATLFTAGDSVGWASHRRCCCPNAETSRQRYIRAPCLPDLRRASAFCPSATGTARTHRWAKAAGASHRVDEYGTSLCRTAERTPGREFLASPPCRTEPNPFSTICR